MNINQKRRAVAVELCALNSLKEDDMEVSQRTQKRTEWTKSWLLKVH